MAAPQPRTPRTHGEASRERRDIVSGSVMEEHQLIRFVAGPDSVVTPDLARKLPGRGIWVAADRASVDTAVKKGLFSRAAKTKLVAPAGLADQVDTLLHRRCLDSLGLARRGGDIISGFEKVLSSIRGGGPFFQLFFMGFALLSQFSLNLAFFKACGQKFPF